jgi:hypothetical protein
LRPVKWKEVTCLSNLRMVGVAANVDVDQDLRSGNKPCRNGGVVDHLWVELNLR